ncbi:response regulator transcription factor [Streptomyces angustmyceticus]|uniref:Helix-turn-helix transcriptional regulator n=2 Tax=Streptomyces angustmyceticus TaxID=285578 RepID=A0A5J4L0P6_9ACTN|nr:response regulator transcription factor [Streptomyces angustmyceticus]GES27663.1 helix-turn-helix transcriptional regulator [Streptomyces angustmyceticus]
MQATMSQTELEIPVVVRAPDPISLAGVTSQLNQHRGVRLVEGGGDRPPSVAVVVTTTMDDSTIPQLRRLVRIDGARVVLVADQIREAELLAVIECGVGAILWRHQATPRRLYQAVLAASRGEGDLPSDLLARLLQQVGQMQRSADDRPGTLAGLAPREIDVIRLIAEGLDTAEIASKLSYSERTVKNVLHGMTTRLHLRNRAHAVAFALREGHI